MTPPRLVLGGYAPRESSHGQALEVLGREIESHAGGRVSVEARWNVLDEGRPATDLLDMVESGEMFLCYFSTSYLGERVPLLNVLEAPFLFPDLYGAHAALDGRLGARLREAVGASTGFEVLGFWDNGFRHLTNRLRPVRTPEDLRGMRIRLQPNRYHEEMARRWGAVPVPVELSDGIRMIRDGSVDAQENPLANTVAYGVHEHHRFATMTAHLYGARGLFADRRAFEALSEELREAVLGAARTAIAHQRRVGADREAGLRRRLEAEGVALVDPTADEREAFARAAAPVAERLRSELGEDVFDLVPG